NMQFAMLLALTLGYATWTSVNVDVQLNFSRNQSLAGNGSDISCFLKTPNDTSFLPELLDLDGVANITMEEHFTLETVAGIIDLRAISPDSWKSTAYYQDEWFTFENQNLGLSTLQNNNLIILERLIAHSLGLSIGDEITLFYEDNSWVLSIVGLFGPEPNLVTSSASSDGTSPNYLAERTWSYVSIGMCDTFEGLFATQTKLLIKLSTQDLTSDVVNELELHNFPVYGIRTFEEYTSLETSLSSTFVVLHVVGVIFSTFLAVFGVWALMTSIRYQRREEIQSMRKRGMGRSTLSKLLFWEVVPLLPFMLLGILVGFVTAFGITFSFQGAATPLVLPQFSTGLFSLLLIPLVFAAVLVTVRASCHVRKGRLM
ncbi:MAG: ABC transporter permease, partial [Candidatus Aegiribacteria sp.]|nr:ABC transporter permease [Candidatus Aegiribacteria sp.]